jgi:hypothetical protein
MLNRFLVSFGIVALAIASAASSYRITLIQPSVVNGTQLKAGDYRVSVGDSKVTFVLGKKSVEVPAKIENVDQKFDSTAIRYTAKDGTTVITEIRLGGTKTKVVLNP